MYPLTLVWSPYLAAGILQILRFKQFTATVALVSSCPVLTAGWAYAFNIPVCKEYVVFFTKDSACGLF
jgi:hypothetical protein